MAPPTPQHIKDRIVELYESGLSIAAIHTQISVSKPTITKVLKAHGLVIRKDNYQSIQIDWGIINQEYDAGSSTYDLASKYNCSDETIRRRIKNLRSESERNTRATESIRKIAKSCAELWQDKEYKNKQNIGYRAYVDSGAASEIAKKHYPQHLGKWIQSDEAKQILSDRVKKYWENQENKKSLIKSLERLNYSTLKDRAEKFVNQSAIIHNDKYDYSKVSYSNSYTKVEIICPIHGSFWQTPINHNNTFGSGCQQCGDRRHTVKEFIVKARETHNNKYDYSKSLYVNNKTKIEIICPIHGSFWQRPDSHIYSKHGCPSCPIIISSLHQSIIDIIPPNIQHISNDRNVLNGLEIDIYYPDHKFGVEIHGLYWHSCRSNNRHRHNTYKKLHALKADAAASSGIALYQFWDFETQNQLDLIKSMIRNRLDLSTKVYARKCQIVDLDNKTAKPFFDRSHLQGHRSAGVIYGLVLDGVIQCALSLSKHPRYEWEIIRYACAPGISVVGGFSKLFKKFITANDPNTILTFADKRISVGNLYKAVGFVPTTDTKPNYFYHKGGQMLSRQQCQKHKLSKLLGQSFNPQLSEFDNMLLHGFGRIYDAGHKKLIWYK